MIFVLLIFSRSIWLQAELYSISTRVSKYTFAACRKFKKFWLVFLFRVLFEFSRYSFVEFDEFSKLNLHWGIYEVNWYRTVISIGWIHWIKRKNYKFHRGLNRKFSFTKNCKNLVTIHWPSQNYFNLADWFSPCCFLEMQLFSAVTTYGSIVS